MTKLDDMNCKVFSLALSTIIAATSCLVLPTDTVDAAEAFNATPIGLFNRLRSTAKREEDKTSHDDSDPNFKEEYPSYPAHPSTYSLKVENPSEDQLDNLVSQAITVIGARYLVSNAHSPWQIFHGIIAQRQNLKVRVGNHLVPAIEWVSTTNPAYKGQYLFEKTSWGARTHKYTEPYHFEGHPNQFLGILTLSNLPLTHEFSIGSNRKITMADLVNNAKMEVNDREEITWTLWFLAKYLDPADEWNNAQGDYWSIEKLVKIQNAAVVERAACGGTHGLFALAYARQHYLEKTGKPLHGVWLESDQKIKKYIALSKSIQNRDGSFPTKYYKGFGTPSDFSERLASTGHIMEWLMMAVSDEELKEPWVRNGIHYLAWKMVQYRHLPANCGPLYHALDAITLYQERMEKLKSKSVEPSQEPEKKLEIAVKPFKNVTDDVDEKQSLLAGPVDTKNILKTVPMTKTIDTPETEKSLAKVDDFKAPMLASPVLLPPDVPETKTALIEPAQLPTTKEPPQQLAATTTPQPLLLTPTETKTVKNVLTVKSSATPERVETPGVEAGGWKAVRQEEEKPVDTTDEFVLPTPLPLQPVKQEPTAQLTEEIPSDDLKD